MDETLHALKRVEEARREFYWNSEKLDVVDPDLAGRFKKQLDLFFDACANLRAQAGAMERAYLAARLAMMTHDAKERGEIL